jgi:hypothetical protein
LADEEQLKIDPRIFILFEILDYLNEKIVHLINDKRRVRNDFWGMKFLLMVATELDDETFNRQQYQTDLPFFLEGDNYKPSFVENVFHVEDKGYYMTARYLSLFE